MSKIISLLLILVMTASSVLPLFPLVAGQNLTYGGVTNVYDPPAVSFTIENGSVLYDVGHFNLGLIASVGYPVQSMNEPNTLQTLSAGVCSVSYEASWQGNQPVILYNLTLETPEILTSFKHIQSYFFNAIDLTHVPEGAQQLTVMVIGGGYIWGSNSYYTFYTSASFSLDFAISSPPSLTPTATKLPSATPSWTTQIVDVNGAGGIGAIDYCPIVLDSKNNPQIAYTATNSIVIYSNWNGFSWNRQAVAVGNLYSLVLDANDTPHLLYGGSTGLTYATWTGLNWASQIVDANAGNVFGALAFDSSDNPNVAYDNGTMVKYASWIASSWNIQTVDTLNTPTLSFQLSLTFNQNNTPCILYGYSSSNNGEEIINFATENSTGWSIQAVPLPSPISGYGNMVLDSGGYPHFICSQSNLLENYTTVNTILYVSWNGTGWNTQVIVSNVQLQINNPTTNWLNMGCLTLDSYNNPHFTYTTKAEELMYASWTGKAWNLQTADSNSSATEPGFLALDSNGNPHISYYGPATYFGYANLCSNVNIMYAAATEPVLTTNKAFFPSLDQVLLIGTLVVVIATVVVVSLLLYRRHRKTARMNSIA